MSLEYNEDCMRAVYKEQQKEVINPAETGKRFGILKKI